MQGWIARSGLQYGTDLVLYEQHPSLVHSTVCVIIVPVTHTADVTDGVSNADPQAVMAGSDGNLSWHDVEGINRLCIRVSPLLLQLFAILAQRIGMTPLSVYSWHLNVIEVRIH